MRTVPAKIYLFKVKIETAEKGVKYVKLTIKHQNDVRVSIDFEQVNVSHGNFTILTNLRPFSKH